jgi:ParB-like chromosome segregation protein Spo0J
MEIIKKPIDSLIPYAKNARVHDEAQIAQIAGSIKEFGFNNPVLIDKDNGIIAGHGRVMAARKLGLTEVPTILLDHLNETQRKAYILADNRIAINSTWDNEMLSLELMDIKDDVSLAMLGFNVDELDNILSNKNFEAGTIDDQGKLDEIKPKYVACPDCGHEFDANDKTTHTH